MILKLEKNKKVPVGKNKQKMTEFCQLTVLYRSEIERDRW